MSIKRWNSKWLELNLTITLFLKFITCSSLVSFGYILLMGILYINQYFQIRHIHTFLRKYYFQTRGKILCSKVFPQNISCSNKRFCFFPSNNTLHISMKYSGWGITVDAWGMSDWLTYLAWTKNFTLMYMRYCNTSQTLNLPLPQTISNFFLWISERYTY